MRIVKGEYPVVVHSQDPPGNSRVVLVILPAKHVAQREILNHEGDNFRGEFEALDVLHFGQLLSVPADAGHEEARRHADTQRLGGHSRRTAVFRVHRNHPERPEKQH